MSDSFRIISAQWDGHRYLLAESPDASGDSPLLVGLHGLGTSAEDLLPLAEALGIRGGRFLLPDAPYPVSGMPGAPAFAWYDFETHDRTGILTSRAHLFRLLEASDAGKKGPCVLFGFSQGGVMALETALAWLGRISGAVSLSGYLPHPAESLREARAPKDLPLLLVHGKLDPVVPVEAARQAERALREAGFAPVLREFPMFHQVTPEALKEVREFLKGVLSRGS